MLFADASELARANRIKECIPAELLPPAGAGGIWRPTFDVSHIAHFQNSYPPTPSGAKADESSASRRFNYYFLFFYFLFKVAFIIIIV